VNGLEEASFVELGGDGAGRRDCLIDKPGGFFRDTTDDLREEKEVDAEGSVEGRGGMLLGVIVGRGVESGEPDRSCISRASFNLEELILPALPPKLGYWWS